MADWANSSFTRFRPYRHPTGSAPIRYFEESTCAATAVIRRGDVVTFDTVVATANHRIVRAPSSAGAVADNLQVGITSLIGVAATDSTSDGSTTGLGSNGVRAAEGRRIGVFLADNQTEFLGFLSSVGAGPIVAASSLIGQKKTVVYDRAQHAFFIASTNTTVATQAVVITDVPSESINDTNGPVIFKFLSSNTAFGAV